MSEIPDWWKPSLEAHAYRKARRVVGLDWVLRAWYSLKGQLPYTEGELLWTRMDAMDILQNLHEELLKERYD